MRFAPHAGIACCLLVFACGGGEQAPATDAEAAEAPEATGPVSEIVALGDYYETHFNMHHASMVADLYQPDAVFLPANGAVHEGREAIMAATEETMTGISPQLTITPEEHMVLGERAVTRGSYTVSGTPAEGDPIAYGGSYMTLLVREGADWRIEGAINNYNADMPPEMWVGPGDDEPPPEDGLMKELAEAYQTHFNLGHAEMVADFFTDDARVSFGGEPWVEGKAAILASIQERMAQGSPQLTIHDVTTTDLGDGTMMDSGWYELALETAEGPARVTGMYASLARQDAEGNWKIHWFVGNGSAPGA